MSRAPAKRLLRRDVVESASAPLLARFFAPRSTYLATRGIEPAALGDDARRTM